VIESAIAQESSAFIHASNLPERISPRHLSARIGSDGNSFIIRLSSDGIDLESALDRTRKEIMSEALKRTRGIQKDAAHFLGMSFRSFRYYAKKYRLRNSDD